MDTDIAISVRDVAKKFRLFSSAKERLIEALHPFRKKYHHEFWALQGVSFDVHRGEIVGILGRNGSGKSTLLQIICSVMQPTQGEVTVNGRISALLELGAGFNPEFSGRENVILNGAIMGLPREEMLRRLPDIEAFADIGEFFDQPVKTYSSGMFVRVAFAAAIHVDPEILIVDEALSVGDASFQHRCYQKIREFMGRGKTILVVSHATDTLLRICNRGVVIEAGELRHVGPIAEAVTHYHALLFGGHSAELAATPMPEPTVSDGAVSTIDRPILSADPTDRMTCRSTYNPHEVRLGNGLVKLVDFEIVVDGIVDPPVIPKHAEVELLVKLYFSEALHRVSFGFALVSVDGVYVGIPPRHRRIPRLGYHIRCRVPFLSGTRPRWVHWGRCIFCHLRIPDFNNHYSESTTGYVPVSRFLRSPDSSNFPCTAHSIGLLMVCRASLSVFR